MPKLFGGPSRHPEAPLTEREMDLARSVQVVTEEAMLRLARYVHQRTGARNLCLAGGVALNCVANGRLLREGPFDAIWIQPAAGDAGGALGAAYAVWHGYLGNPRTARTRDTMRGALLGPAFDDDQAEHELGAAGAVWQRLPEGDVPELGARLLSEQKVVGWFSGRMEFGPRALGARSILGDARSSSMQSVMNQKIKFRESFRPFAPSVLASKVSEWFELEGESPYMLLVADVAARHRVTSAADAKATGLSRLELPRSTIPAVTHVDGSARIQTVAHADHPAYHDLISAFDSLTGCPLIVNTSFNVRGEPIVCRPIDAYRCFMRTNLDCLIVGNLVLKKSDQPSFVETEDWRQRHELD